MKDIGNGWVEESAQELLGLTDKLHNHGRASPAKKGETMNSTCRKILVAYVAVLAMMLFFPPTRLRICLGQDHGTVSYGFRFIGSVGKSNITHDSDGGIFGLGVVGMDVQQLSLQVVMVSLMAGAGYLIFKDRRT